MIGGGEMQGAELLIKMQDAVKIIGTGISLRAKEFIGSEKELDIEKVASVVMQKFIFGGLILDEDRDIEEEHEELISRAMDNLAEDEEVKHAITDSVRVLLIIASAMSDESAVETTMQHIEWLQDNGYAETDRATPEPGSFIPFAVKFFNDSPGAMG